MLSTSKFIINHQVKLWWKLTKHSLGVLFMVAEREGKTSPLDPKDDVFARYLDTTRNL